MICLKALIRSLPICVCVPESVPPPPMSLTPSKIMTYLTPCCVTASRLYRLSSVGPSPPLSTALPPAASLLTPMLVRPAFCILASTRSGQLRPISLFLPSYSITPNLPVVAVVGAAPAVRDAVA